MLALRAWGLGIERSHHLRGDVVALAVAGGIAARHYEQCGRPRHHDVTRVLGGSERIALFDHQAQCHQLWHQAMQTWRTFLTLAPLGGARHDCGLLAIGVHGLPAARAAATPTTTTATSTTA